MIGSSCGTASNTVPSFFWRQHQSPRVPPPISSYNGAIQWETVRRRLFTILSALSLLLFVAVVVLWVRSYWRRDTLYRQGEGFEESVLCAAGRIYWGRNPAWHTLYGMRRPEEGWHYGSQPPLP